ncbi:type II secretion system F family protein [Brevibacillus brevis]|uniref:type II secretion system F family protein n=1 Tax=Brevibacillus brevis TaxID=1393 RepID=UPI00115A96B6|nr:type II secretion system F family protein [Lysinibacillus sp. SDF0063]TQR29239.1 pilus assembly protein TadC [Lysinibacillus sp. SDF0063]
MFVLVLSILVSVAIFLYGLPSCVSKGEPISATLLGRIDSVKQAKLEQSFQQGRKRWTLVRSLEKNQVLLQHFYKWTGVDKKKTEETLARLGIDISLTEIVLFRLISMCFIVSSLFSLSISMIHGEKIGMVTGLPLTISLFLYLLPNMLLDRVDKRAKAEIREQVPIFFSIVQSLVEAGMPLQQAVKQTARRFDARLGRELASLEMGEKRHGNWRKALEELAFRWEVDSLTTIALEMNEAMKKGVSISQMLSVQVEEQVRQQEDEAATHMNRLNIRLLPFVILLMGLPLLFLVMGPAFIGIGESL